MDHNLFQTKSVVLAGHLSALIACPEELGLQQKAMPWHLQQVI